MSTPKSTICSPHAKFLCEPKASGLQTFEHPHRMFIQRHLLLPMAPLVGCVSSVDAKLANGRSHRICEPKALASGLETFEQPHRSFIQRQPSSRWHRADECRGVAVRTMTCEMVV